MSVCGDKFSTTESAHDVALSLTRCDAGEIIVAADKRRAELEVEERAARPKRNEPGPRVTGVKPVTNAQKVAESYPMHEDASFRTGAFGLIVAA
ncbi:hypothetical protein BH09MYX1_BH09MYX1_63880 [soil metagenome]